MNKPKEGWIDLNDPNYKSGLTKIRFSKRGLKLYKKAWKTLCKILGGYYE